MKAHQTDMLLRKMYSLQDGWNSYGAPRPSSLAIQNASRFIAAMRAARYFPTHVGPSAVGGVGVSRRVGTRKVYVEHYNNGSVHALFADDATEELETCPVEMGNIPSFIQRMRSYLEICPPSNGR